MNYAQAIAYLDAHIGAGNQPGLERIRLLVDAMGSPHEGYPTIHVAGTNGKTSTTRLSALLLVAHGLNAGTYISPHLEGVEERLGIHGRVATRDEFAQAVSDVAAFADLLEERDGARFSYFELTTAMAFAFFADQAVEAAVVEVGLGGRLDATNVIDGDVAVLTGVDLEHTEYLGTTVEAIAKEKLAIVGPGAILVTGPLPESVFDIAEGTARDLGIQHRAFGRDFTVEARTAVGGWHMDIHGAEEEYLGVHLPVHGRHQTVNAAVAVAAVEALLGRRLDADGVAEAVAAFAAPGRMELVTGEPLLMLDGAHNPAGFKALDLSLGEEFPTTRWVLVLGAMGDKDLESMVRHVSGRIEAIVATSPEGDRALSAAEVAKRVMPLVDVSVEAVGDPLAAMEVARQKAGSAGAVLVAGSIYLVGALRRALITSE
ncbi:MAG TPA: Mur ligase family protein [Acidimicrobiia bacterium]|nr:Mur ligase family protein [Acidimicrobiia bacterium]